MTILNSHVGRTSPLSVRLAVTAFGLLALSGATMQLQAEAPPAGAQTPASTNVKFDVASIKRNKQAEADRAKAAS